MVATTVWRQSSWSKHWWIWVYPRACDNENADLWNAAVWSGHTSQVSSPCTSQNRIDSLFCNVTCLHGVRVCGITLLSFWHSLKYWWWSCLQVSAASLSQKTPTPPWQVPCNTWIWPILGLPRGHFTALQLLKSPGEKGQTNGEQLQESGGILVFPAVFPHFLRDPRMENSKSHCILTFWS